MFLGQCNIVSLTEPIKECCIDLKQKVKIKTPDSIVAATAIFLNLPLLTADRLFDKLTNLDSIIYTF